jgi:DNA-binding MurR/RpiR family transcriptional regulator
MTKTKPKAGKRSVPNTAAQSARRVNDAEPAHSIIRKLGGVRALAAAVGVSPAAVTRWQTHKTDADRNGCDGVIPEFRRAAVIAAGRAMRRRVTKAEFIKS